MRSDVKWVFSERNEAVRRNLEHGSCRGTPSSPDQSQRLNPHTMLMHTHTHAANTPTHKHTNSTFNWLFSYDMTMHQTVLPEPCLLLTDYCLNDYRLFRCHGWGGYGGADCSLALCQQAECWMSIGRWYLLTELENITSLMCIVTDEWLCVSITVNPKIYILLQ